MGNATRDAGKALAWGAFLASSWTWCIGMFLPVLLMRDYGGVSFWVFALPNIVGAGAMAWVLSRWGASERLVERYPVACAAFSAVTLAFQVFFLLWMLLAEPSDRLALVIVGASLLASGALAWWRAGRRPAAGLGVLAWMASVGCGIVAIVEAGRNELGSRPTVPVGTESAWDVWLLAPVCIFGFGLCPYLDLTFHRARRALDSANAKLAFGVGFGVLFAAMIGLTLWYGPWMAKIDGRPGVGLLPPLAAAAIAVHIALQATYTAGVHDLELREARARGTPPMLFAAVAAGVILGVLAGTTGSSAKLQSIWMLSVASIGELIYRIFMSFYGLVFPAYVWIVVRRGESRAGRLYWAAVAAAAPFFWVGVIGHREPWLIAGLAVVIGAGLVRPGRIAQTS